MSEDMTAAERLEQLEAIIARNEAERHAAENAKELLSKPDIDGALVGGASLDSRGFTAIIKNACSE